MGPGSAAHHAPNGARGAASGARHDRGRGFNFFQIVVTHVLVPAARLRPSCLDNKALQRTEGAGKAGCPPHPWSACNKNARGRTTGTGGSSGLPCAMVLRLIRDLPGDHAWLPPSVAGLIETSELSACIGAPGPHDFAVRRNVARLADIARVHRIPPHVRDDAYAPLAEAGRRKKPPIEGARKANYFRARDWTTQISLNGHAKSDFARTRFQQAQRP